MLLSKRLLKGRRRYKALKRAQRCAFTATVTPADPGSLIALYAGTAALKVYPVSDATPSTAIFCREP